MDHTAFESGTDVTIRPAHPGDEAGIARAHVAGWHVAYRGVIPDETLDALSLEEWIARWRERLEAWSKVAPPRMDACFVAMDAHDEIIGFAHGGTAQPREVGGALVDYDAEVYAIYLNAGMQGRGVGRRLARAVAMRLAADGLRALIIFALADNPYHRFYVSLGGAPVLELDISIFGQPYREIGYGWPNIQDFIARSGSNARQER